jgi:hypothetical protein
VIHQVTIVNKNISSNCHPCFLVFSSGDFEGPSQVEIFTVQTTKYKKNSSPLPHLKKDW